MKSPTQQSNRFAVLADLESVLTNCLEVVRSSVTSSDEVVHPVSPLSLSLCNTSMHAPLLAQAALNQSRDFVRFFVPLLGANETQSQSDISAENMNLRGKTTHHSTKILFISKLWQIRTKQCWSMSEEKITQKMLLPLATGDFFYKP